MAMDKILDTRDFVAQIRYFKALSRDPHFTAGARRLLAESAEAMLTSYAVDDHYARLVK